MEDNYKKEIDLLRGSNRKIKVELEQTKVCNVKLQEDMVKQKLDYMKDVTNVRSSNEKLKSKLSLSRKSLNQNSLINASLANGKFTFTY